MQPIPIPNLGQDVQRPSLQVYYLIVFDDALEHEKRDSKFIT